MDPAKHEKADELYKQIDGLQKKVDKLEKDCIIVSLDTSNNYRIHAVRLHGEVEENEMFDMLKNVVVSTLKRKLALLKIEYYKL